MMNETEHLLVCLSEEFGEGTQGVGKALRFGLDHVWPELNETNRRYIERELAQAVAVAEMLGLVIREEDKLEKKRKLEKFMKLSMELGTLEAPHEVDRICRGCRKPVPRGFYECMGNGSHVAARH